MYLNTNKIKFNEYQDIYFVGDIHGKFREFGNIAITRAEISDSVFVLLGDVGMGFHKPNYYVTELEKLSKKIGTLGNKLVAFRGNHDDPAYFKDFKKYGDNITLLPDYSTFQFQDKNILVIGGALSVDRKYEAVDYYGRRRRVRKENVNWWPYEEEIIYDEDKIRSYDNINIVCTHSAPSFVQPFNKRKLMMFAETDSALIEDVSKERKLLTDIHDLLKKKNQITHWFYGHFHETHSEIITDVKGNDTKFECVDINGFATL